jgi:hypothetical protein
MTNNKITHGIIYVILLSLGFLFFYKSWELWVNGHSELLKLESKLAYFIGRKGVAFAYLFGGVVSVGEMLRMTVRSMKLKT